MHAVDREHCGPGSFLEVQALGPRNAIVGLARMYGQPWGLWRRSRACWAGVLDIDASDKITRFVRFCDAFGLPLVTLVIRLASCPAWTRSTAASSATGPRSSMPTRRERAQDQRGHAQGLRRRLCGHEQQVPGTDINLAWPSARSPSWAARARPTSSSSEINAAADPDGRARPEYAEEYRTRYSSIPMPRPAGAMDDVIEPRETRAEDYRGLAASAQQGGASLPAPPRQHARVEGDCDMNMNSLHDSLAITGIGMGMVFSSDSASCGADGGAGPACPASKRSTAVPATKCRCCRDDTGTWKRSATNESPARRPAAVAAALALKSKSRAAPRNKPYNEFSPWQLATRRGFHPASALRSAPANLQGPSRE